ncbi:hypothetical protein RJ640_022283 [Escallonia rubra]|uniref:Uncharacterized protein n=1 Tax=Escallonia rubra TaxID=112253 RepID=A0AA88QVN7_9ASTE|nr:hypothetical protein RJ640_022283 [Escallonia rubra]
MGSDVAAAAGWQALWWLMVVVGGSRTVAEGRFIGRRWWVVAGQYGGLGGRGWSWVHPDIGISSKAMGIMNNFINDIFEKLAQESSRLAMPHTVATIPFAKEFGFVDQATDSRIPPLKALAGLLLIKYTVVSTAAAQSCRGLLPLLFCLILCLPLDSTDKAVLDDIPSPIVSLRISSFITELATSLSVSVPEIVELFTVVTKLF